MTENIVFMGTASWLSACVGRQLAAKNYKVLIINYSVEQEGFLEETEYNGVTYIKAGIKAGRDFSKSEYDFVLYDHGDELPGESGTYKKIIIGITQDEGRIAGAGRILRFPQEKILLVQDFINCKITKRYISDRLGLPAKSIIIIPFDYVDRKQELLMQYGSRLQIRKYSHARRSVIDQIVAFITHSGEETI